MAQYFYPRSPCGERLVSVLVCLGFSLISIHALLAESDPLRLELVRRFYHFYPRSPCGERPPRCRRHLRARKFLSTLSLRRATLSPSTHQRNPSFLSTLSLRRATAIVSRSSMSCQFLSTLSLRRATPTMQRALGVFSISIHALLAESDPTPCPSRGQNRNFYPRSPCGERPALEAADPLELAISIHALLAESDVLQA